jgi:hypothetical protein
MKTWRMTGSLDLAVSPSIGVVDRHRAPAEHGLALGLDDLLEALLQPAALDPVARQEDEAAAVLAGGGQRDARLLADLLEEGVRHLQQHAGAVAGVGLGAGCAAVVQVLQDLDRLLQDLVRLAALDVDHEADAAGVVLEPRVVEALLRGQAVGLRAAGRAWSGLVGISGKRDSQAGSIFGAKSDLVGSR